MAVKSICVGCGRPTSGRGRCQACSLEPARRQFKGYNAPGVRKAMAEAVQRAGCCARCGTADEILDAHMPGAGRHTADPGDYLVLCRSCHRAVEAAERV